MAPGLGCHYHLIYLLLLPAQLGVNKLAVEEGGSLGGGREQPDDLDLLGEGRPEGEHEV